jgi:lysophospholipase L1-like esterase
MAIMATALACTLLFNTRILATWAEGLENPVGRTVFLNVFKPLHAAMRFARLDIPEERLYSGFRPALARSSGTSSTSLGKKAPPPQDGAHAAPSAPAPAPEGSIAAAQVPAPAQNAAAPAKRASAAAAHAGQAGIAADSPAALAGRFAAGPDSYSDKPEWLGAASLRPEADPGSKAYLFIGDSLLASLLPSLKRSAPEHPDCALQVEYGIASAIVQSVYCDWPKRAELLVRERDYDAVLVFLGTNDGIAIHTSSGDLAFDGEAWRGEYKRRIRILLDILTARAPRVYWVGVPPMRKSGYREKMVEVNRIAEEVCAEYGQAEYVDLAPLLGDAKGRYRAALPIGGGLKTIRHEDGIHYTQAGAQYVTDYLYALLAKNQEGAPAGASAGNIDPF